MTDPRADVAAADPISESVACVLVADDEPSSRRLLALTLEASGYRVRTAVDGREAVEMATVDPPDVLLLDFDMPGLNGVEVCAALRQHEDSAVSELPIIMLTAHDGEPEEVACLHAGANDFVAKPVARASLLARIETQLRLRSLNASLRVKNEELARWQDAQVADLEAAQKIQLAILPQATLPEGWTLSTFYAPLIQVGGDIYGVETRNQGSIVWLADATGHGVAAALCTTLVAILFQRAALVTGDPAEVLARVNAGLFAIFHGRTMMTAICARISPGGRIRVAGAGHPPLLVRRADGRVQSIASRSTLLGLRAEFVGKVDSVLLQPGDAALFLTDGLFSSRLPDGARQEVTHVPPVLAATPDLTQIAEILREGGAFDDDVTALLFRREAIPSETELDVTS